MSKAEKLLLKIWRSPAPKDLTWGEFLTLMSHCGFQGDCAGGSHYTFEHSSGVLLHISKTHPSGILKAYQIKDVRERLTRIGKGDPYE